MNNYIRIRQVLKMHWVIESKFYIYALQEFQVSFFGYIVSTPHQHPHILVNRGNLAILDQVEG